MIGRYDASYGCLLLGQKNKQFRGATPAATGLRLKGDIRDLAVLTLKNGSKLILAAANNDQLQVFQLTDKGSQAPPLANRFALRSRS